GGSGKSYGAMSKIILKSCGNVRTVLVIRKVKATILDSIYALTREILTSVLDDFSMKFTENKSELTINLSNGSKFIFKGMDNPEKIKSINGITDIVIEEATELSFEDFTQLDIRLRPKDEFPQIFLMFNPVSKVNWCYKHWFSQKISNTKIIKTTYLDNKFISKEYKKTLENLIYSNPNYYKVYCLGEFTTLDKLIFNDFEIKSVDENEISHLECFVGLDFGYVNDPTAIIRIRYSDDTIYILEEFAEISMLNRQIFEKIVNLKLNKLPIVADCAERKSIDELKKMGLKIKPCRKGSGSILNDINFILSHKIVINDKCAKTIEEFQNYTWTKDSASGEYVNKPIDKHNHLIDALRYALQNRRKSNISVAKILKEY
ncbi:MAG: PBSX family phage terminase large subunit, partial [Clostridia bacterium]